MWMNFTCNETIWSNLFWIHLSRTHALWFFFWKKTPVCSRFIDACANLFLVFLWQRNAEMYLCVLQWPLVPNLSWLFFLVFKKNIAGYYEHFYNKRFSIAFSQTLELQVIGLGRNVISSVTTQYVLFLKICWSSQQSLAFITKFSYFRRSKNSG